MVIKLQNGDKFKVDSDEKREARKRFKEYSLLPIGLKLKRNLNIASNFLKSGPSITNFGNAVSALFGGYSPEDPDLHYGEAPGVGIKNFRNLVRTARVAREFNDVVKGPVNQFKLLNNFIEKFVTNPKGSGKLIHYDKGNGKSIYQLNRGASIINGKLVPGKTKREGLKNYTWWNTDNPYINVHKAKEGPLSPTRYIVVDDNTQFKHPFDLKEPVGQSAGKGRGFILPTERVTDKPVDLTNAEIYEKSPFGWWERVKSYKSSSDWTLNLPGKGDYSMSRRPSYSGYTPTKLNPVQSKFVKDVMLGHRWGMNRKTKPAGNKDFTEELKGKERLGYGAENDVYKDVSNSDQVLKIPGNRNGIITPHSTPLGAIREGLYIIRPFNRLPYNLPLNIEGTMQTAEGKYIPVFSLRKVYVPLMDQPKIIDFDKSVNGMYSLLKPNINNILLENDIQGAKDFKLHNLGLLSDGTVMGIDLWKKGGKLVLIPRK